MHLAEQWFSAWTALGISPSPALHALHSELIRRYSEPHRYYHTLRHLAECFERLAELESYLTHKPEVQLALWFHDTVYNTHRSDNEALSAQWAADAAQSFGVKKSSIKHISELILSTRHTTEPQNADAKALVDADLAILGADPERYAEYEQQIRQEYAWVPEPEFQSQRAALLKQFLARKHIFSTGLFRQYYEHQARANLQASLTTAEAVVLRSYNA